MLIIWSFHVGRLGLNIHGLKKINKLRLTVTPVKNGYIWMMWCLWILWNSSKLTWNNIMLCSNVYKQKVDKRILMYKDAVVRENYRMTGQGSLCLHSHILGMPCNKVECMKPHEKTAEKEYLSSLDCFLLQGFPQRASVG